MDTIQPGDIAIHIDGTIARVIYAPSERDPRIGVAFWLTDEEGVDAPDVMQMAWKLDWCEDVLIGEAAPGHEFDLIQMQLPISA